MDTGLRNSNGIAAPPYTKGPYTWDQDLTFSGAVTLSGTVTRTGQIIHFPANYGKAGTTAGWTTANNTGVALLPAAQTASTFTLPLTLKAGWIIKSFKVSGQIESDGGAITLDADLRATTAAAADLTDASIGAITQISKTADYKIVNEKTGLSHTVISGNSYYVLFTGTSAASTDIALQGIEVTITEN